VLLDITMVKAPGMQALRVYLSKQEQEVANAE